MSVVRITRGKVQSGTWEEFEEAVRQASAEVGPIPGLISRSLLRHSHNRDEGFSISVWESEDTLRAYEQRDRTERVLPRIQRFFTDDYQSDHCEVRYWNQQA